MENTVFVVSIPHLFSLSSAFGGASNSYNITPSFNIYETLQISQFNLLFSNSTFVQGLYGVIISSSFSDTTIYEKGKIPGS